VTRYGFPHPARALRRLGWVRLCAVATLALLLLAPVVFSATPGAALALTGSGSASVSRGGTATASSTGNTFGITGGVSGLYPCDVAQLPRTVTNRKPFPISVTSISTSVAQASPGCLAGYLSVSAFTGHLTVPATGNATATVTATLSHAAPDACQGATFALTYTGQAVKA
jgi:hypothetical protein